MSSPCFFFVYTLELSPAACRCSCVCGNYRDCDLVAVLVTPPTLLLVLFFLCGYYKHLATCETELPPSFHLFKKTSLTWWPFSDQENGCSKDLGLLQLPCRGWYPGMLSGCCGVRRPGARCLPCHSNHSGTFSKKR